jgi:UDP-N-acetylglucosamine 2-epimerase (non-hydrolysing)
MKIAPFIRAIGKHNLKNQDKQVEHLLVHTGQHYDERMSDSFFIDLGIPAPDYNLGVGSGSHAAQVGKTMMKFEKVLRREKPDWVVVVGDVNATLACSVTAKKENIKCCHIESGLRSGDMTMPEEINRLVTDRLSDLLLVPDAISMGNLRAEGVDKSRMVMVGNIMIDTLNANIKTARKLKILDILSDNFNKESFMVDYKEFDKNDPFALITLHRPSNVDDKKTLTALTDFFINEVAVKMKVMWPIHPRTEKKLKEFKLWEAVAKSRNIFVLHPTSYHQTLRLNSLARIVLTDSGGLQEECTVLGTPCLTLRNSTERPVTLTEHNGASVLVGNDVKKMKREFRKMVLVERKPFRPPLWDGRTAERCLKEILKAK